jgi:hypothetical protein
LCCRTDFGGKTEVELFGTSGSLTFDGAQGDPVKTFANLRAEFAEVARTGASHPLDVHRGLYLQRLLAQAAPSPG